MTQKHRNRQVREARLSAGLLEQRKVALRGAGVSLAEAGRVLSSANEEKLRAAQDAIAAVLAGLEAEPTEEADGKVECATCGGSGKIREGAMECPDCGGEGKVTKEARASRLGKLAEAYSAAATDAGSGAWLVSSLLDLMSEESDEPGELAILQAAFSLLMQWLTLEVASIGSPDDQADSAGGDPWDLMWGWESARKRLVDSGGAIKPPAAALFPLREGKPLKTDLVAISEAAVKEDGTGAIKIIAPGWGSSGYYSEAVLERDGPAVFAAGTKMFWDHPTLSEEFERPERSLRDLAGELTGDARWDANGSAGPGLYADTKVFEGFAGVVNELAPSIGVSIRAYGQASMGEAEGQTGTIIDRLVGVESVDFVTFPGAGGQVLQLFEAARRRLDSPQPEGGSMEVEKDPKFVETAARAARAEAALVAVEARDVIAVKLAEATSLPVVTREKLKASLAAAPPVKDGALDKPALEARIEEAIGEAEEYIAKLTEAGTIKGMGGSSAAVPDVTAALEQEFVRGGLSESAAKTAAAGRK